MKNGCIILLFLLFSSTIYSQEYELIWNDDFNESGLPNTNKWSFETGAGGWGNNELQYYTDRSENARIENGHLIIELRKEPYGGANYTSARLVSTYKGDWKYGKIEVRAKLPSGLGTWPAIWMLPTDWVYGNWPSSGEIDIMEHVGYDTQTIFGTVHTDAYNHTLGTQKGSSLVIPDCETNFHNYGIIWNAQKIEFYVDDNVYYSFANEGTWQKWPFDQGFHLLLNIAFGGDWGGAQGIDESLSSAEMIIDYVHVYQELGELTMQGQEYALPNENLHFEVNNIDGASYIWHLPAGVKLISGQSTNTIQVEWGQSDDSLSVEISKGGDTTWLSKMIKLVAVPENGQYLLSNFSDGTLLDIQPVSQPENTFNLKEEENSLRIDYYIKNSGLNPYLLFTFDRPVYMGEIQNMWLNLKTYNQSNSVIVRFDLYDLFGRETNISPVFKIEQVISDGEFHEYGFNFNGKWQSSSDGNVLVDSTKIAGFKMYINYGFFGKDEVSDSLWIKDIKISDQLATFVFSQMNKSKLYVWPNPVSDILHVDYPGGTMDYFPKSIIIYDLKGNIVYKKNHFRENIEMNISQFSKGIYLLKVTNQKQKISTLFIKE